MKGSACWIAALCVFAWGCGQRSEVRELKLSHSLTEDHAVHKGMMDFARRVAEKSGGTLRVKIYANGQLGSVSQCLELLQIGSLDIAQVPAGAMESFVPEYKVLSAPYIYRDDAHRYAVLDGEVGQDILDSGKEYWLKGLCFYDAGSRSFYTTDKPVRAARDVEGLKIRVMKSITANRMISQMGGVPVPISWGELYTALQQGVVDGAENNLPSFYLSRHYETCKYFTVDRHTAIPDVLVIGTLAWARLSPQERKWVADAAKESVPIQRRFWKAAEMESLQAVKKAGVKVIQPDLASFQTATENLLDGFKQDEKLRPLIDRIIQTK